MVLPLTWTVNCEAPMTVARMRWPGSISGRPVRRLNSPASAAASGLAISPNSSCSWPKMYSATPPENVKAVGTAARGSGSGALGDLVPDGFIGERLRRNFQAEIVGDELGRLIDPRPGAVRIGRNQPATD